MSDADNLGRELRRLRGRGFVVQDSIRTGLTVCREDGTSLVVLRPKSHLVEVLGPGVEMLGPRAPRAWVPMGLVAQAVEERLARVAPSPDPD